VSALAWLTMDEVVQCHGHHEEAGMVFWPGRAMLSARVRYAGSRGVEALPWRWSVTIRQPDGPEATEEGDAATQEDARAEVERRHAAHVERMRALLAGGAS
jgi:hypothetical protein